MRTGRDTTRTARTTALLLLPLVLVGLTGCADDSDDGYVDFAAYEQEYHDYAERLPLPEGDSYGELRPPEEPTEYGVDAGRVLALSSYTCFWTREYLRAHDDSDRPRRNRAEERLVAGVKDPMIKYSVGNPEREALDEARLGDLTKFRQEVAANCPEGS